MKFTNTKLREYTAFLLVGGANTVLTYLLYMAFLQLMTYRLSYSLAYVSGIIISYFLNSTFVFREPVSLFKFLQYPVVYVVQYLLGIVILYICVDLLNVNQWLAPLVVVIVTLPVTFVLSRLIIKRKTRISFRGVKGE